MKTMKMKTCEICGKTLPESDFSKSYRNRCKPCVAEQTRNNRINGLSAKTIFIDEPRITEDAAELRLVESTIGALINKHDGCIMDYECDEIGARAVRIAHAAMSRMKLTHR